MRRLRLNVPEGVPTSVIHHTVAFYETDGMGIVHHSNYLCFLELARVAFMNEHDRPYTEYMAEGLHVPVTRVDLTYHRGCRFAEVIDVFCWLDWARHASLGFAYRLEVQGALVACGHTEHAVIDAHNRPTRLPESMRARLATWLAPQGT